MQFPTQSRLCIDRLHHLALKTHKKANVSASLCIVREMKLLASRQATEPLKEAREQDTCAENVTQAGAGNGAAPKSLFQYASFLNLKTNQLLINTDQFVKEKNLPPADEISGFRDRTWLYIKHWITNPL